MPMSILSLIVYIVGTVYTSVNGILREAFVLRMRCTRCGPSPGQGERIFFWGGLIVE